MDESKLASPSMPLPGPDEPVRLVISRNKLVLLIDQCFDMPAVSRAVADDIIRAGTEPEGT